MASIISPRILRRGLEVFAGISALGFAGLLFYGNNFESFAQAMLSLHWGWVVVGVALAAQDWVGGGLRLWVLVRHVYPRATLKDSIMAGGLNTWASYLTPSQTGGGPMMIYALKRAGTPLPEAMISGLMSFVATVIFFAVLGPLTVFFGAGRSLERHGVIAGGLTLLDLYRVSLGTFIGVGLLILFLFMFPGVARQIAGRVARWFQARGSQRLADRVEVIRQGIDQSHDAVKAFLTVRGWLALALAVLLSGLAHANKLLAGFVVLRMLGIHAHFVDVFLLQTLITFLLYFAPTPGGSGLAELLSAAVMSIYVPRELTPSYILLWRIVVSYLTVAVGSYVFWQWLKMAEDKALQTDGVGVEPETGGRPA